MTLPAVRFVSEDADWTYFEAIGIPFGGPFFGGRDLYRSFADAKTTIDHSLADADGTHPLLFDHGMDPAIGYSQIGRVRVRSVDDKGEWIAGQLNRHHEYHDAIRQLMDEGALAISSGSHPTGAKFDTRNGHWEQWVPVEYSTTPIEANPFAVITSVRSAQELLDKVRSAVRGWLPEGTTQGDLDDGDFAWLASDKKLPDSQRRKLPYKIHGKVNEDGWKAAWTRVHQMEDADFDGGPNKEAVVKKLLTDKPADVKVGDDAARSAPAVRYSEAAMDASAGSTVLGEMLYVLGEEAGEPEQAAAINEAIAAWQKWMDMERAEIGQPGDLTPDMPMTMSAGRDAIRAAIRAGKRNSASDQAHIDAIHQHVTALGASAHAGEEPDTNDDEDDDSDEPGDADSTRSADRQPARNAVRQDAPLDIDALRSEFRQVARATAADMLQRPG